MTTTMKALRKIQRARGLSYETAPVPSTGPTDVLVRVKAASICGTDLHIYGWDRWSQGRIKPPVTLGHEFCGVVERVGEEVTVVKPGDFVSAEMHVNCGHCHQCRLGQAHICQNLRIIGIDQDGAFAEFVKIPASNIWKLDPAIPEHYGAILDPLGNAVHTVLAGPIAGQTVLITGCGPIGQMSIAVASLRQFDRLRDRNERASPHHGQENGRRCGAESRGGRCGRAYPLGYQRDRGGRAARNVR
jgi:threonine 3-dehydrogenase